MKIYANSLTKRNSKLMAAAVACDAVRRACQAAGHKDLGAFVKAARVTPGKAAFVTGNPLANHELSLMSTAVAETVGAALAPFFPGVASWKVTFA